MAINVTLKPQIEPEMEALVPQSGTRSKSEQTLLSTAATDTRGITATRGTASGTSLSCTGP
jgi:hypothetical protein